MLTEMQIEYVYEKAMDLLDKQLINNSINQKIYNTNVECLNEWANQKSPKIAQIQNLIFSK
jgi:hypothetical protein